MIISHGYNIEKPSYLINCIIFFSFPFLLGCQKTYDHWTKEKLLEGWRDYFVSILNNRNANLNPINYPEPSKTLQSIKTTPFTRKEIEQAIKEPSRKKALGRDYALTAEVLKNGGHSIRQILRSICNLVFN